MHNVSSSMAPVRGAVNISDVCKLFLHSTVRPEVIMVSNRCETVYELQLHTFSLSVPNH